MKYRVFFIIPCLLFLALSLSATAEETGKGILTPQQCGEMAVKVLPKGSSPEQIRDASSKAKGFYYRYLMNFDMAELVGEVRDNFESAVKKAEERFDKEDPNISQSDILKLKLGLVGVQKELNEIAKDRERAKLELLEAVGVGKASSLSFPDKGLTKLNPEIPSLEECLEGAKKKSPFLSRMEIEKAHINLLEAKENVNFIKEARKYSRGLLVVALANFDMGIGEGKDLFESLYIYNRSVKDYIKEVYKFNMAVEEMAEITGRELTK